MRTSRILLPLLLLTAPALHAQSNLEQVRQSLSQGRYAKAARELQRIAIEGGATEERPRAVYYVLTVNFSLKDR